MKNQAAATPAAETKFAYVADWTDEMLARVYEGTLKVIDEVAGRGEGLHDLPYLLQAVVTEQHRRAGKF